MNTTYNYHFANVNDAKVQYIHQTRNDKSFPSPEDVREGNHRV